MAATLGFDPAARDILRRPIWIFDFAGRRIAYTNEAALRPWHADTLENHLARNSSTASGGAVRRTDQALSAWAAARS